MRGAAGLGQRAHEPLANHVVGQGEDWNLGRRPLRGANRRVSTDHDDVDAGFHNLGCMLVHLFDAQGVPALVDREVLALDEAEPPKLRKKRDMMGRLAWTGEHRTDPINPPGLLRACPNGPSNSAAEQQYDHAPGKLIQSHRCFRQAGCVGGCRGGQSRAVRAS